MNRDSLAGDTGCVVIILVVILCFTAYAVVDRLAPKPVPEKVK